VIPLRDLNPTRSRPVLTHLIIAVNVAVFGYQLWLGDDGETFIRRFGLVPAYLTAGHAGSAITPLTSMFMHGGFLHIIANMWSLWIFGDNVEDALGKWRFLLFYFACGIGAAAAQLAIGPSSMVPMVGASGAIAGVLAAYLRLFPSARVVVLLWFIIFVSTPTVPAWVFILIWFGFQVLSGLDVLHYGQHAAGGVAVFAHIGGFLAGLLLIRGAVRGRNPTRGFRPPGRHAH
jgi:membrane associated rhomboid family serine protease